MPQSGEDFKDIVKELREDLIDLLKSSARTEGWMEATRTTLESINSTLADVSSVRQDLATLKERDKHPDPLVLLVDKKVDVLTTRFEGWEKSETRKWIEGLVKVVAAGGVGGALSLWGNHIIK